MKIKNKAQDIMIAKIIQKDLPASKINHLGKPLNEAKVALITSGGVHKVDQAPFDGENGDVTYRAIDHLTPQGALTISHGHYDEGPAMEDMNVIFPMQRLEELVDEGFISASANKHITFMGYMPKLEGLEDSVNEVIATLKEDGVDIVILVPT